MINHNVNRVNNLEMQHVGDAACIALMIMVAVTVPPGRGCVHLQANLTVRQVSSGMSLRNICQDGVQVINQLKHDDNGMLLTNGAAVRTCLLLHKNVDNRVQLDTASSCRTSCGPILD